MNNDEAGSNLQNEPAFVLIGRLQRTHGVGGEIAMRVLSDFSQRMHRGRKVFLGEEHRQMTVSSVRAKNELLLLSFEGVLNREEAQALTNLEVYAKVKDLPALPEGTYYHHQLIGLRVFEREQAIGTLVDILVTGANDVYVISDLASKELLLPAIPSVILSINLTQQRIDVCVPEGLRVKHG
ncbi:MAG: ribosome maturation factor RimM [Anaerolineaceae bacterium]